MSFYLPMLFASLLSIPAYVLICLYRNRVVLNYLLALNHRIYEATKRDIYEAPIERLAADPDIGAWRWQEMEAVGYLRMVLMFWRSPQSFFPKDPARRVR